MRIKSLRRRFPLDRCIMSNGWARAAIVIAFCMCTIAFCPQYSAASIANGDFENPGGWEAEGHGDPSYVGPQTETDCAHKNAKGLRLGKRGDTKGKETSYVLSDQFDCSGANTIDGCIITFWYKLTDNANEEAHISTRVGVVTTSIKMPSTSGQWKHVYIQLDNCPTEMKIQFDLTHREGGTLKPLESTLCIDDVQSDCPDGPPDPEDPESPTPLTLSPSQDPIPITASTETSYDPFDCNGNGVFDGDDIAGGYSEDINENGFPDECEFWPRIAIEKTHGTFQGTFEYVSITMEDLILEMGGFDFLIAYDASALAFVEAEPGQLLEDCGWEYFSYRHGVEGNCGDACPSGLLRIIALAETSNGANHPSCYGPPDTDPHELATMTFFVSNDRTLECQYVPIRFFWDDCNDNSVSSVSGETLYVSEHVYEFEGTEITDSTFGFPTYFGIQQGCLDGVGRDKPPPRPFFTFLNGGIDIICADSIDLRGDINCNGIPYEIADVVMLARYFVIGLIAFDNHIEASVAASDVNADGIVLSVADLVYMIRVILGLAPPMPKLAPSDLEASAATLVNHSAFSVAVISPVDIGAGYFFIEHSGYDIGEPQLINGASDMTLIYSDQDGVLKVLVYSLEGAKITAGTQHIFAVPITGAGSVALTTVELADSDGRVVKVSTDGKPPMPKDFALHQNYPNPFNMATTIMYELPSACHVRFDIFNVLGQKVATLVDAEEPAGVHSAQWNGADGGGRTVSSGMYLYRITAAGYSAEKKMMLVK